MSASVSPVASVCNILLLKNYCQQRSNINPTVLIRCLASDRVFCFCIIGDAVYFPPDHGPGGRTTRCVVVAAGVQVCHRYDDRRPKSCLYRLETLLIVRHPAIKSEYLHTHTHTPYPHTCDNLSSYTYFCSPTPCLLCPYLSPKKKPSTLYEKKAVRFRAFELSAAAAAAVSVLCIICYLRAAAAAAEFTYRLRAKMAAGR